VHHLKLAENAKLWVDVSKAKPRIAAETSNLILASVLLGPQKYSLLAEDV